MMCKKAPRKNSKNLFGGKRYVRLVGNKARQSANIFVCGEAQTIEQSMLLCCSSSSWGDYVHFFEIEKSLQNNSFRYY